MCLLVFYNKHFSLLMAFQMSKHVAQNYTHLVLLTIYVTNYFNSVGKKTYAHLATSWTVRGPNPGEGEIFRTCPDRPWSPPNLLYNGYRVFPGGKERPGRDADPSPPSSAVGQKRVELNLYFAYGPYGLYRASVPVQGVTFTTFTHLTLCSLVL